ncbi:hypothetical protein STXM2123_683 [Streptomyces sp. F-3]|nr:hypothetical protein STXM2123_683 [Streptomyces sp. F-3]
MGFVDAARGGLCGGGGTEGADGEQGGRHGTRGGRAQGLAVESHGRSSRVPVKATRR